MKPLAIAVACSFAAAAFANAPAGKPAPGFTVADLAGKPVNLSDYKGKTVVLEWHNFGCPFVQKHYRSGNMQALQKKYGGEVVWLAVNSTHKGSSDWTDPPVLDKQLKGRDYVAGAYSIADMAIYPWVRPYKNQGQDLAEFPALEAWFQRLHDRPAVARGVKAGEELRGAYNLATDKAAQAVLFGQRASKA